MRHGWSVSTDPEPSPAAPEPPPPPSRSLFDQWWSSGALRIGIGVAVIAMQWGPVSDGRAIAATWAIIAAGAAVAVWGAVVIVRGLLERRHR